MKYTEKTLSTDVSNFLQTKYKDVIFRFDIAADLKLSIGQATRNKKLQGGLRGFPDLFIAKPNKYYHGLYIELKIKSPFLKDSHLLRKDKHLEEQSKVHQRLRDDGYFVSFATGLKETIEIIELYMDEA